MGLLAVGFGDEGEADELEEVGLTAGEDQDVVNDAGIVAEGEFKRETVFGSTPEALATSVRVQALPSALR